MRDSIDDLIGKKVMNKIGVLIGTVKDSLKDDQTGKPITILVEPSTGFVNKFYKIDEKGNILFPYDTITTVKNAVIVEELRP
ncbi:MAG: PRC-barrel domain-containing protein [Candidatus Thermoplasmatota archaeon]|nr:PRC-barrel domain-containing protein [Candidatus Thermoplasmatota archaeon]